MARGRKKEEGGYRELTIGRKQCGGRAFDFICYTSCSAKLAAMALFLRSLPKRNQWYPTAAKGSSGQAVCHHSFMEVIVKRNGIVAVWSVMALAVSACALPDHQAHQHAAPADLSNSTSARPDAGAGLIEAQAHVLAPEKNVPGEAAVNAAPADLSSNTSPRSGSEPRRIEAQTKVSASKKNSAEKKAGKPAASTPSIPSAPRDRYFEYLFSLTIDDPQWKNEIGQCADATYARHMGILKKGMENEIANATLKSDAEEMRNILGQLDDPLLFKANCIKNLILQMYGWDNLPAVSPKPAQVRPKEQVVEWAFPTNAMQVHRKELSEKALMAIRKKFHASFAGPNLATDAMYPYIKDLWLVARKSYKTDVNYFSMPSGEASTIAGPALFHRGIYLKLASSKKYAAGVVQAKYAVGTGTRKPNLELHPVKRKN
jgi:hypothetical protein